MPDKQFKISVLFDATTRRLSAGMRRASSAMMTASKSAANLGNALKNKVSMAANKAAVGMRRFAAGVKSDLAAMVPMRLGVVGLGAAVLNTSMKFNKAMANIATLIPQNKKRILELKEGVQEMAMDIGKSTDDLAGGLYQVVSAFGDSSESMEQLEINAKAATAGMATTSDAIALTSAVTKGYGNISAAAMKKAADLAFMTVKLGQTDFPQLASSIGRTIPFAAKMNIAQEELFAGFATLTGVTGTASEVSTQMAAILKAMLKPTTAMKRAVKGLGYESAAAMVKENGMTKSLQMLMKQAGGSETAAAKLFGRAEALTAVFALTGKQAEDFDKKMKEMNRSAGAMDIAFKEVSDGVNKSGHEWEKFKATLSVTAQEIGDVVLPIFSKLIEFIGKLIRGFRELFKAETWKNFGKSITSTKPMIEAGMVSGNINRLEQIPASERTEEQKKALRIHKGILRTRLPEVRAELKRVKERGEGPLGIFSAMSGRGMGDKQHIAMLEKMVSLLEMQASEKSETDVTLRVLNNGAVVVDNMNNKKGKSNIKVFTGTQLGAIANR